MNQKPNRSLVPKLRFPEFRDAGEWKVKEVGEIFKVTRGEVLSITLLKDTKTIEMPYPVYSSQTKSNGLSGFYSEYLYEDAITWTTDGANAGDVNYRPGKFYCTNVCGVLLSTDGYANLCIAALINSVSKKHVSYVGNPKLMNGVMSKIKIPFPPLLEQQKIAECLASVDDRITLETQKLDAIRSHKKGLMQQLFPAEGQTLPRIRFPEFRDAGEWEEKKLGDIATIRSGTTPSRSKPEFYIDGNIPWVKTTDLNNSYIYTTEEKVTTLANMKLNPEGSVLVAMYGGFNQIGRTGYLKTAAATNQAISVINIRGNKLTSLYLLIWLNAKIDYWKNFAISSRKDANITGADVAAFPIVFPSLPEQQKIADCLSSLDELITLQTQKIDALKLHKKGLMQQLFPSVEEVIG